MFGKILESELLGETKRDIAIFQEMHETPTYMKYRESIDFVKNHQRANPLEPKRFFPKSLRNGLKQEDSLNISTDDQIAYYTALNSPLDQYHGVDAFFEYKNKGKTIIVTFDVTANPNKDSYKADVILSIPSDGLDPSDPEYDQIISHYVDQIKEQILTKMDR